MKPYYMDGSATIALIEWRDVNAGESIDLVPDPNHKLQTTSSVLFM